MHWIWIILAALIVAAGLRYRRRLRALRGPDGAPRVDDAAIRQILEQGSLRVPRRVSDVDMRAAARAEEQFWDESWEEPEEYRP